MLTLIWWRYVRLIDVKRQRKRRPHGHWFCTVSVMRRVISGALVTADEWWVHTINVAVKSQNPKSEPWGMNKLPDQLRAWLAVSAWQGPDTTSCPLLADNYNLLRTFTPAQPPRLLLAAHFKQSFVNCLPSNWQSFMRGMDLLQLNGCAAEYFLFRIPVRAWSELGLDVGG